MMSELIAQTATTILVVFAVGAFAGLVVAALIEASWQVETDRLIREYQAVPVRSDDEE